MRREWRSGMRRRRRAQPGRPATNEMPGHSTRGLKWGTMSSPAWRARGVRWRTVRALYLTAVNGDRPFGSGARKNQVANRWGLWWGPQCGVGHQSLCRKSQIDPRRPPHAFSSSGATTSLVCGGIVIVIYPAAGKDPHAADEAELGVAPHHQRFQAARGVTQQHYGGGRHQLRGLVLPTDPVGELMALVAALVVAHWGFDPIIRARTPGSVTNTGALSSPSMASFTDMPPSTASTCPVM